MFEHKEGCLGDPPGCAHRVPIECTTREGLEKAIKERDSTISTLKAYIITLKADLYDAQKRLEEY